MESKTQAKESVEARKESNPQRQVVRREGMRNTGGSGIERKFSAKHAENETGFQLLTSLSLPLML